MKTNPLRAIMESRATVWKQVNNEHTITKAGAI